MTLTMTKPDFSGYATKANIECSDGRTIMPDAFKHQDGKKVPLVWAHVHNDPEQVIGYGILSHRADGVWVDGYFNNSPKAVATKEAVRHGDVSALSIFANKLKEQAKSVFHGVIREVSVVLAGANPEAFIEEVQFAHGDNEFTTIDDAAIIYTGVIEHADSGDTTDAGTTDWEAVYNGLTEVEKELVHIMLGASVDAAATDEPVQHSDGDADTTDGADKDDADEPEDADKDKVETVTPPTTEVAPDASKAAGTTEVTPDAAPGSGEADDSTTEDNLDHQEGTDSMTHNLFKGSTGGSATGADIQAPSLTHDQMMTILEDADEKKFGSLKASFLNHATEYGINDITLLFPDAKDVTSTPQMIQRKIEWVAKVIDGTKHLPFAKVKTTFADITADEARAKGYVTGTKKVEEVIQLLRRSTGPTTIYKKQKLDRDDLLDITGFDVVNWLWGEINMMLLEELARAILVGDGRSTLSTDKVKDPTGSVDGDGIRSILNDDDLFVIRKELAANVSVKDSVKGVIRAMAKYRGSGRPTLFMSTSFLTEIMLEEDKFGRSLYETRQAFVDKLGVESVVTVDLFDEYDNLFCILVNLDDYSIGTNAGGQLTKFDDFDIDYNQYKYLLETRLSGGLTKPYSAVVVTRAQGTLATAQAPSFNGTTDDITIPTTTGVTYLIADEPVTGTVHITKTTEVEAEPKDGYYLETNSTRTWTYSV